MSKKQFKMLLAVVFLAAAAVLFFWLGGRQDAQRIAREQAAFDTHVTAAMPDGGSFVRVKVRPDAEPEIVAMYENGSGNVVGVELRGYASELLVYVGVDTAGVVTGVTVARQSETRGLGDRVQREDWFTDQFTGKRTIVTVGQEVDALSGATVTSRAVTRAVNLALGYVGVGAGIDAGSGATEWEG